MINSDFVTVFTSCVYRYVFVNTSCIDKFDCCLANVVTVIMEL